LVSNKRLLFLLSPLIKALLSSGFFSKIKNFVTLVALDQAALQGT